MRINFIKILLVVICFQNWSIILLAKENKSTQNDKISVVVWDERQEEQKEAYDNYLGNYIADYLRGINGVSVMSVALDDPDLVIFEERWPTGEWFRSGSLWTIGKGNVFYFRPGHELYPVFKDNTVLKIIENAIRWLGEKSS